MEYLLRQGVLFGCSWKDLVSKVNAQMDEEQAPGYPKNLQFAPQAGQEVQRGSPRPPNPRRGAEQGAEQDRADEEELEMGMEMFPLWNCSAHTQSIGCLRQLETNHRALRRVH